MVWKNSVTIFNSFFVLVRIIYSAKLISIHVMAIGSANAFRYFEVERMYSGVDVEEEKWRRRWIHRWPGFLGSWKVFSSADVCKHCCLLESSLLSSLEHRLSSSSLFPMVFLRLAGAISAFSRWKGSIGERKYFGWKSFMPKRNETSWLCIVIKWRSSTFAMTFV